MDENLELCWAFRPGSQAHEASAYPALNGGNLSTILVIFGWSGFIICARRTLVNLQASGRGIDLYRQRRPGDFAYYDQQFLAQGRAYAQAV